MKQAGRFKKILRFINHYFVFFLLIAFVITCCTTLFVSTLRDTLDLTLTDENIKDAAKITFLNVLLLTFLLSTIDALRRKLTVERPVRHITQAAQKIVEGDFSVRIKPECWLGAQDEFNQIICCFNRMAEELGGVETLRTDFIANVSHEMKTPLAVLQNYGTLLQQPHLPEEKRMEYARGVAEGSRRMADMMTNILKLNRLENQQIYPEISEYDLGEQLCRCLLAYENVWEKKNIEICTDLAEDVGIKGDAQLLEHVWNNLFANAFQFTPPGGRVSVSLTATRDYATVRVQDTGCGMTPEVGAHIFEKFYQGDPSHSSRGNGLGLALVKRVMDIVEGEISVQSRAGEGSVFTVRIRRG